MPNNTLNHTRRVTVAYISPGFCEPVCRIKYVYMPIADELALVRSLDMEPAVKHWFTEPTFHSVTSGVEDIAGISYAKLTPTKEELAFNARPEPLYDALCVWNCAEKVLLYDSLTGWYNLPTSTAKQRNHMYAVVKRCWYANQTLIAFNQRYNTMQYILDSVRQSIEAIVKGSGELKLSPSLTNKMVEELIDSMPISACFNDSQRENIRNTALDRYVYNRPCLEPEYTRVVNVHCFGIEWDISSDDDEEDEADVDVPNDVPNLAVTVSMNCRADSAEMSDAICSALSDKYGYCVNSFDWEPAH